MNIVKLYSSVWARNRWIYGPSSLTLTGPKYSSVVPHHRWICVAYTHRWRGLTDEYRQDLETAWFHFSLHIWMLPLRILDAATSHSPTAHQQSTSPSHRHHRPTTSSTGVVWATSLAASASTAVVQALEPDAAQATKSQPGPPVTCGPLCQTLLGHQVERHRSLRPCCVGPQARHRPGYWVAPWSTVITHRPLPGAPPSPTSHPAHPWFSLAADRLFATIDHLPAAYYPPDKVRDLKFRLLEWVLICMRFELMVNLS
jgi:hypothetical protein